MRTFLLMLACLVVPSVVAAADFVELRTGERIEGKFRGADEAVVRLEKDGKLLTFKLDEVRSVRFGAPATMPPASASQEAVKTLKALRSMTAERPTYSQYMGRLAYTKTRIELLWPKLTDHAVRAAVASSMRLFSGAGDIWAAVIRVHGGESAAKDRTRDVKTAIQHVQEGCAPLARLQGAEGTELIDGALPAAWSCAGDKIAEAENLLVGG